MRYLVTGASGFVGGAVCRRILDEGDALSVIARDAKRVGVLAERGAKVFETTVGDPNAIVEAAKGCEVVIHAAAASSHRDARRALEWVNVAGTENVLNAARQAGCSRVVYVSCADVTLSNEERVNWNEDRELMGRALDAHAESKRTAEELAVAASSHELEVTALRPAWLWGPGDTSTLPGLCREGLGGGIRLVGSGDNLFATTYIENLVDALVSAAEVAPSPGHAYYVADDDFVDAREFFDQLSQAAGLPPPRSGLPLSLAYPAALLRSAFGGGGLRPSDIVKRGRGTQFDCQNARRDLDWEPATKMPDGMNELARWVEAQGGPTAIATLERAPASAASVDAQVAAAGGD